MSCWYLLQQWACSGKSVGLEGEALLDCLDENRSDTLVHLESEFEGEGFEEDLGDAVHDGVRRVWQARHISKPLQAVASTRARATNKSTLR